MDLLLSQTLCVTSPHSWPFKDCKSIYGGKIYQQLKSSLQSSVSKIYVKHWINGEWEVGFHRPGRCPFWMTSNVESVPMSWWRHQMETFSALLAICAENSPVPGEFPTQRPVTRSFDVFFDLRPNKRLSKQSWGWWSETPSSSLWRHRNVITCSWWCYITHQGRL